MLAIVFVNKFDIKSHQNESDFQRHVHAAKKSHLLSNPVEDCHFTGFMQLKVSSPYYNVYTRSVVFAELRKTYRRLYYLDGPLEIRAFLLVFPYTWLAGCSFVKRKT